MWMHDLVLRTRLETLSKNLQEVKNVGESVKKNRADIRTLQDLCNESIQSLKSIKPLIIPTKDDLEANRSRIFDIISNLNEDITSLEKALIGVENCQKKTNSIRGILDKMESRSYKLDARSTEDAFSNKADMYLEKIGSIQKSMGENGNDEILKQAWEDYDKIVPGMRKEVFSEYVDFMHGLAMRDAGLDNEGICEIADELINKCRNLGVTASIAIPEFQEALTMTMASLIRLGFPDWTIYSLPLAAHEIGHVMVFNTNIILEDAIEKYHKQEYLADIFATSVMGIAYAYAVVLLRFNPLSATDSTEEHPSEAKRAYIIFDILNWINVKITSGTLTGPIQTLKDEWEEALRQAGKNPKLKPEVETELNTWLTPIKNGMITEKIAPQVYNAKSWTRAIQLKDEIDNNLDKKEKEYKVSYDYDLCDVLNAAWLCRIEAKNKNKADNIEQEARRLWHHIQKKKSNPNRTGMPGV